MPIIGDRPWALLLVLAIILIIWGPGKLPEMGAGMGRAIREFRKASSETREEVTAPFTAGEKAPPGASQPGP